MFGGGDLNPQMAAILILFSMIATSVQNHSNVNPQDANVQRRHIYYFILI